MGYIINQFDEIVKKKINRLIELYFVGQKRVKFEFSVRIEMHER